MKILKSRRQKKKNKNKKNKNQKNKNKKNRNSSLRYRAAMGMKCVRLHFLSLGI